jgi:hypothetical protein
MEKISRMKFSFRLLTIGLLIILLAACSQASLPPTETAVLGLKRAEGTEAPPTLRRLKVSPSPATLASPESTEPVNPTESTPEIYSLTPTRPAASPTPRSTLAPEAWKELPVVPPISQRVVEIYQRGLAAGNNPGAFSKIGDCGSTPGWFLGDFDRGPRYYDLGEYEELSAVIKAFQGSYDRVSLAARSGFNSSALFVPLWSDRTYCQASEAPLACEYRVLKPSIAFIMLGTNDVWHPDEFEPQMRKIIEYSIANGVIPILSTKADNQEGDDSINATIARLAWEYDVPLWNFWAAAYPLPDHGLQEDQAHLSWGRNTFDDPEAMTKAWPVRNLTALQILNAVWEKVSGAE